MPLRGATPYTEGVNRRHFMQMLASSPWLASCGTTTSVPTAALGEGWGRARTEHESLLLPAQYRMKGVLEFYFMGGLNPWDTFYVVPDYGKPNDPDYPNQQWWTFQNTDESVAEYYEKCGGTGEMLFPFDRDDNGRVVHLGPWASPLFDRPDILNRMRIQVVSHPFEPHQVGTPLMLCGHPRGVARMASTPSHLQRYFLENGPTDRVVPYSYALYSGTTEVQDEFNVASASASGLHPSSARPFDIRLMENNPVPALLQRTHLAGRQRQVDAATQFYMNQFVEELRYPDRGNIPWSRSVSDLWNARRSMHYSKQLSAVLSPELLSVLPGDECQESTALDVTGMGVTIGRRLLTRTTDRARYVTCIDTGMITGYAGGYDSHDHHVAESARNVTHSIRSVAEAINRPGENDPTKLNLDDHLILLTSEFGRTPYEEKRRVRGLNHWPFGFVVVMIGGPITEAQRGVFGAIGPGGYADSYVTPPELRASLLLAQGIWPFSPQSFAVGDIRNVTSEEQAARELRQRVLGHPV